MRRSSTNTNIETTHEYIFSQELESISGSSLLFLNRGSFNSFIYAHDNWIYNSPLPNTLTMMSLMMRPLLDRQVRPPNMMVRRISRITHALRDRVLLLKALVTLLRLRGALRRDRILERLSNPMEQRSMVFVCGMSIPAYG